MQIILFILTLIAVAVGIPASYYACVITRRQKLLLRNENPAFSGIVNIPATHQSIRTYGTPQFFTKAETEVITQLYKLVFKIFPDSDNIVHLGIRKMLIDFDREKVRQMVKDLRQQSIDAPKPLKDIIGEAAFEALLKVPFHAVEV